MILVLGSRYSDDARIIGQAALMQGWDVVKLASSKVPDDLRGQDCRVYAEGFLAEHIAQALGLHLLRPADDALAQLESGFLQRNVRFCRAADFQPLSIPAFVKPADQKLFPARVYSPGESIPGLELLQPDDPILISDVVDFVREYRFFVANRQIRTGSIYVQDGQMPNVPVGYEGEGDALWPDAIGFARRVSTECPFDLPDGFTLDVGLLHTGQWAVIEFNPAWASGIYGCDPFGVLECLIASEQWNP